MIYQKYRIKKTNDEDIKPEETLADTLSEHSVIEVPIGQAVFRIFYLLIIILAVFLSFKAFQFQAIKGEYFAAAIEKNVFPSYPAPALRGIIYDSSGKPLVENIPIFDLVGLNSDLSITQSEKEKIVNYISPIINISPADLLKIFDENKNSAVLALKKNISKEEMAKLKVDLPKGIYVLATSQRNYSSGPAFSGLLGYTSKVNANDMKKDDYYLLTDRVGRLGLEQFYEEELRGDHRNITIKKDQQDETDEKPGHDLFLNINGEMQSQLCNILNNVLSSAGLNRGAAVVQNSKTGAVLALASLPTFDSNVFENLKPENDDKKIKLLNDPSKPLFNRIVSGRYSPGSTIKPFLALIGLKEGVVTPNTTIYAGGSISVKSKYDPSVTYTFKDWKVHGWTDLGKAIADSVDVYFYALGGGYGDIRGLGEVKIISYLKSFLADKTLGIDFPGETSGFVPDEEWKKQTKGEDWFVGDTYNISIGQGDLGVTPLWLNAYVSAIANGGNLMKPYIVKEIKNPDGSVDRQMNPEVIAKMPFDQKTIDIVKQGMRQTVESGTATMLANLPVQVAAKTGTAQITGQKLNSLFVVFGPYENPEITMTVLVENIESQGLAIRVAHDFLSWYFGKTASATN